METDRLQTPLELAVIQVSIRLYQQGILKAPITQKGQLEMIEKIDKIEQEIIKEYQ